MITKKLLRPKEVCEICTFSASTLERLVRNPESNFPRPLRIGRWRYWHEDKINDFLKNGTEAQTLPDGSGDGEEGEAA